MEITKEMLEGFEKGQGKRITINGETKNYPTYKIPLKYLWFNDENGRIITEIAQYKALHKDFNFDEYKRNDLDGYENLLKELVELSSNDSKKSFYETKESIKLNGQKEAGVILSDGRIIDGNRRFACLVELFQETKDERFATFEAAWFPAPLFTDDNRWKFIKEMEHSLQFNIDPVRKYSRIALLESFYHDTLCQSNRGFTKKEYCDSTGMKPSDYDKDKRVVEVMLDFLQFIKHPREFWIIKEGKWDTALEEIADAKVPADKWVKAREVVYSYLMAAKDVEVAKNIKKIIDSAMKGTAMYKELKIQFYDQLSHDDIVNLRNIINQKYSNNKQEISQEQESQFSRISKTIADLYGTCQLNQQLTELEVEPITILDQIIKQATNLANNDSLLQMRAAQDDEFKAKLEQLENIISKIKKNFNW